MKTASDEFLTTFKYLRGERWRYEAHRLRDDHEPHRQAAMQAARPAPAASLWPAGTAKTPARTISAMNAAVKVTDPNTSAAISG